ncbi:MAG: zinc ribbon domain-containing protein [Burkholderiales bacterium]
MFCRKCGAPVNAGESFCSACGEKIEAARPSQFEAQPAYQQPYVQPGQQQNGQTPYGQPPYGQPPKKKSKAVIWVIAAVVAVLAIAALLLFVVFPAGGFNWPFAGNTTQTRFINDSFRVFSGSFSGMGGGENFARLAKEPFEIGMDITTAMEGQQSKASIQAAYDSESLGLRLDQGGQATTVLLLENVLYSESGGITSGIRFETEADMSKSMTLEQRINALFESYTKPQTTVNVDFGRVAEMFVNSIDEGCFERAGDSARLTLDIDDIIQTLRNFSEKLENDKQLLRDLEDYAKSVSGMQTDIISSLDMAVNALEEQKSELNFKIVLEIKYRNAAPASLTITFDDGSSEYVLYYGYDKAGDKTKIDFSVAAAGTEVASGTINFGKTAQGIEYSADITAGGETLSIKGSEQRKGGDSSGEVTITIPGIGNLNATYETSLKFGKPSERVADKFKVDTDNANIIDASNAINPMGSAGISDPSELLPWGSDIGGQTD